MTLTPVEVAWLPAASRARAVSVCAPFVAPVVFHEMEYGDVVSSTPRATPSSKNCTPTTPTASVALADTVMIPETVPVGGTRHGNTWRCCVGHDGGDGLIGRGLMLPTASAAVTR